MPIPIHVTTPTESLPLCDGLTELPATIEATFKVNLSVMMKICQEQDCSSQNRATNHYPGTGPSREPAPVHQHHHDPQNPPDPNRGLNQPTPREAGVRSEISVALLTPTGINQLDEFRAEPGLGPPTGEKGARRVATQAGGGSFLCLRSNRHDTVVENPDPVTWWVKVLRSPASLMPAGQALTRPI